MAVNFRSFPLDGPASSKLGEVRKLLTANGAGDELALFADALFSRAPSDYAKKTSVDAMVAISQRLQTFYHRYRTSDKPFLVATDSLVKPGEKTPVTAVMTAITDRPFVIDTLTELLDEQKIRHRVLLHPILQENDGETISLVYLELQGKREPKLLASLQTEIELRLSDLILVTDDFPRMLVHAETVARLIESGVGSPTGHEYQRREYVEFLKWLADGGFVFLGYREWEIDPANASQPSAHVDMDLGLFRTESSQLRAHLEDTCRDASHLCTANTLMHFSKVLRSSPVHRAAPMDVISIKTPRIDGKKTKIFCFIGLLTSKAVSQEGSTVPLIRRKLQNIVELEGLAPNTHDYKEIISIADSIPKDDLFQFPVDRLRKEINNVFDIQRRDEVRVSYYLNPMRRFASVNVVVPRARFSGEVRKKIQHKVEQLLNVETDTAQYHLTFTDYPLVIIRLLVPNPSFEDITIDIATLERDIEELTLTWADKLYAALTEARGEAYAQELRYHHSFPAEYKATTSPRDAVRDITMLHSLTAEAPLEVAISRSPVIGTDESYQIKLFRRGESLTLSGIIPYLENIGFEVQDEIVTGVTNSDDVWAAIYNLRVRPKSKQPLDLQHAETYLLPGLKLILNGTAENDGLNALLLNPGLRCRQIAILRTLSDYLWQIKATASPVTAVEALTQNPTLAKTLVEFFETKFDPSLGRALVDIRQQSLSDLHERFTTELKSVDRLIHDRSLRALLNVTQACVRTNYFLPDSNLRLSLKIDCAKVAQLPKPRPLFEIFVNAPEFEGVHLRGGLVARGGLRWSERKEDYRTEVLGLMKTQMVKNSIIVPVGAKGGFLIKQQTSDPQALPNQVQHIYSQFIRSLLEITDNRIDDSIVRAKELVVYDGDDPYLVVAADRGTATFSDLANKIAQEEFSFWLADAFASGGSNGYDHKKLGITARGAWEAVCRHFREIGIDVAAQDFTVVGMGDMSGDVFGNGMLLSERIKLVAAFNHKHIFIDPDPDPATSFAERKRLFELPRSNWTDYQSDLLSEGGAIYDRSSKEIHLAPEAVRALGLQQNSVSGEELVRAILTAPVDLLWNGGIGTYVKAYDETNFTVGDRANDEVRVNARDLRAKVIGEGGNLGLTQLARIEYSKIGGHVNTDAVDNSGGVDLSDLEVNLKILLSEPVRRGEISIEERNELLEKYANECRLKVITRNRTQSKTISLAVRRSRRNLAYYRGTIDALEAENILDRESEFLPDDETFDKRIALKAGLTRPELAVLIAHAKMSLFNTIIESSLPEEPFLQQYLYSYFPRSIGERFASDVEKHPLRREIISTQIANIVVERMGASFIYRTTEETGAPKTDILSSFLAASEILGADQLTTDLTIMDSVKSMRSYLNILLKTTGALDSMSRWILEYRNSDLSLSEMVDLYGSAFKRLMAETETLLTETERNRFHEACRQLIVGGVPKELAQRVTAVSYANAYLDVAEIARIVDQDVTDVAHLYAELALALNIQQLLEQAAELEPTDRWEALALRSTMLDIRRGTARLTRLLIQETGKASPEAMRSYLELRTESLDRYRASLRAFTNKPITIPALLVISNQLAALSRSV